MPIAVEMIGRQFGRLIVIRRSYSSPTGVHWTCRCACGNETTVHGRSLRQGLTQSCGCLNQEASRARMTKHGHCRSPEYRAWCAMLTRCTNPNAAKYEYDGGRGVTVCEAWRDFAAFLRDMGQKPDASLTLDRIDPYGNYEPGNVRWATWAVQRANKRGAACR